MYDPKGKNNWCGGSIYSETVVVTAAGCCQRLRIAPVRARIQIVAGDISPTIHSEIGQRLKIESYLIHPNYTENVETNDICLLYLKGGFNLTTGYVKNISLATNDPEPNTECNVSGWTSSHNPPGKLKWSMVTTITNEKCKTLYQDLVPELQICVDKKVNSKLNINYSRHEF